jgi:hypothetical protein
MTGLNFFPAVERNVPFEEEQQGKKLRERK